MWDEAGHRLAKEAAPPTVADIVRREANGGMGSAFGRELLSEGGPSNPR